MLEDLEAIHSPTRARVVSALRVAAAAVLAFLAAACASDGFGHSLVRPGEGGSFWRYDASVDPPEQEVVWRRRGTTTAVVTAGDIELSPDERGIERLAPDAFFLLEEEQGGERRELLVEPDGEGRPTYRYAYEDAPREFDAGARDWLASRMPEVLRRTAVGAPARARRLLETGGAEALLAATVELEDDRARAIYVEILLDAPDLPPARLAELARAGAASAAHDSTRVELLLRIAPRAPEDAELTRALAEASASIGSSSQRAQVLQRIVSLRRPEGASARAFLVSARGISAASERQATLTSLLSVGPLEGELLDAWLAAVGELSASSLQSEALEALVQRAWADATVLAAVARAAGAVSSGGERARVVELVLVDPRADAAALGAALDVVAELSSSSLQQHALEQLLRRPDLERATLRRCVEVAARLSNASARVAVQEQILERLLAEERATGDSDC